MCIPRFSSLPKQSSPKSLPKQPAPKRRRTSTKLSRHHRRRRRWAAVRQQHSRRGILQKQCRRPLKKKSVACGPDSASDGLLDFFEDVVGREPCHVERESRELQVAVGHGDVKSCPGTSLPKAAPADGPGGSPEGWEPPIRSTSHDHGLKRDLLDKHLETTDGQLHFPHLDKYFSSRPIEPPNRQRSAEALRYYGGASGSASATTTDDGYLTKLGAKRVCVVCLEPEHKARACPQLRCFVCFGVGHQVKQCPKAQLKCGRCGRKGHSEDACIWQFLMDAARWHNWSDVRCANCGEYGHPACRKQVKSVHDWELLDPITDSKELTTDPFVERSKKNKVEFHRKDNQQRSCRHRKVNQERGTFAENGQRRDKTKHFKRRAATSDAKEMIKKDSRYQDRRERKAKDWDVWRKNLPASLTGNDLREELRKKLSRQQGRNGSRGKPGGGKDEFSRVSTEPAMHASLRKRSHSHSVATAHEAARRLR